MEPGQIRYSLVCREDGGVLDDVLIYRLHDSWGLVVNAGNRDKIRRWIEGLPGFESTGFVDQTVHSAMIAVQGPRRPCPIAVPDEDTSRSLEELHRAGCGTEWHGRLPQPHRVYRRRRVRSHRHK